MYYSSKSGGGRLDTNNRDLDGGVGAEKIYSNSINLGWYYTLITPLPSKIYYSSWHNRYVRRNVFIPKLIIMHSYDR